MDQNANPATLPEATLKTKQTLLVWQSWVERIRPLGYS